MVIDFSASCQTSPGSPWDGGRTDFGIGGLHAGAFGAGCGSRYYDDPKLGTEAAADAGETGFKVGRDDEDQFLGSVRILAIC
jgi:hypothetical protein